MTAVNEWQARYGQKRRAIDRALLAECERQIAREECALGELQNSQDDHSASGRPNTAKNSRRASPLDHDARAAIALAFGRPLT